MTSVPASQQTTVRPHWLRCTLLNWKWWCNLDNQFEGRPIPILSLTVAIPAHNDGPSVRDTIESVLSQTYNHLIPVRIILVDDGSTDETGPIMESYRSHPQVDKIIHTPKKTGRKAAASMLAFEHVSTDLFLALDGDGHLSADAIEKSISRFSDPRTQMVAGCVVARNHQTFFERARTGEYLAAFSTIKPAQDKTFGLLIASGCFSIVRTAALRAVGGYSTRTLGEDLDLTLTMHEHHLKVVYASDAVCTVVDPRTTKNFTDQITRWYRSYIQNMRAHGWSIWLRNPWVAMALHGYFLWSFVSPFFLLILFALVLRNLPLSVVSFFGMWAIVTWLPMFIKAAQLKVNMRIVLASLLPMFIAQYVNIFYFYKVFAEEFGLVPMPVSGDGWEKVH